MPLFGKSHKSPQEVLKTLREALVYLSTADRDDKKAPKVGFSENVLGSLLLHRFFP